MPRKQSARKSKPNKRNVNANKSNSENAFKSFQQNLGEETPDESDTEGNNSSSSSSFRSPATDVNATNYSLDFTSGNVNRRTPPLVPSQQSSRSTQRSSRKPAASTQQPRDSPSQQNLSSPQRTTRASEVIMHSPSRQSSRFRKSSATAAGHSSRQVTEGRSPTTSRGVQSTDARRRKQTKPKNRKYHVLKEIIKLQKSTNLLIPRLPFARLFREIALQYTNGQMRVSFLALEALQEATELYASQLFQDAYRCTLHRGRVTLEVRDLELTRFLRGFNDPGNPY